MPTGVSICSLLLSAESESYHIYILAGPDLTDDDKNLLKRQVESLSPESKISFIDMGGRFSYGYEVRNISVACYYRLMIPWIIPNEDKIIYCDGDIIFHTSLRDLYDVDVENVYVAGAKTVVEGRWAELKKYFDRIGVDHKEYINSGVLVINSKLQREDCLNVKYNELTKQKYLYQDQDIINIVCKGRIGHVSYLFNLPPYFLGESPDIKDKYVLHYAGDKPWRTFTYAWDEWWEVYRKSHYCDMKFYHDVCARILSPKAQMKNWRRKASIKMRVQLSKLFANKLNF